jgi:hypothetical protein
LVIVPSFGNLTTNYVTQQKEKKPARYRNNYADRGTGGLGDNLTNLLALADALNTTNTGDAYTTNNYRLARCGPVDSDSGVGGRGG